MTREPVRIQDGDSRRRCGRNWGRLTCAVLTFVVAEVANGQTGPTEVSVVSVWGLRAALGYDIMVLAALGVSEAQYDAIAGAAISHVQAANAQLAPLLDAYHLAADARTASHETLASFGSANDRLEESARAIATADQAFAETLRAQLTPEQQALHDRLAANQGLDVPLALVGEISDVQRAQLKAIQRARDWLALDPSNAHRQAIQQEARRAYDEALPQILTPAQGQEYQSLRDRLESNLAMVGERELAVIASARLQAAASPKVLPSRPPSADVLHGFFRSLGEGLRRWATAQAAALDRTLRSAPGLHGRASRNTDAGLAVLQQGG